MTKKNLADYLTVKQVAEELSVQRRTVLRQIKAGNLKAFWFGRGFLVEKKELERFRKTYKGRVGHPRVEVEGLGAWLDKLS
ncbi:MAG: helix-turn-helix domain-containing protein [bacterium]|nr:helix-turn-helix domain-containing protein [bacterium]